MVFNEPYALGWIILIIGVAALATLFGYRKSGFDKPVRYILMGLRFVTLVLVGLLALNPTTESRSTQVEKPLVVWLQDKSLSVLEEADSSSEAYPATLKSLHEELKGRYEVVALDFALDLYPEGDSIAGEGTDIGNALREGGQRTKGRNVAALVLTTDGISTHGVPLNSVRHSNQYPIFTLGLGDSTVYPDLRISNVIHNDVAFAGNTTPIELFLHQEGLLGPSVKVDVLVQGQLWRSETVPLKGNQAKLQFDIPMDSAGVVRIDFRANVPSGDLIPANNRRVVTIEVKENKKRVHWVYSAPHPDMEAFRLPLIKDQSFEVRSFQASSWNPSLSLEADVLLFHDYTPNPSDWSQLANFSGGIGVMTTSDETWLDWTLLGEPFDAIPMTDRSLLFSGRLNSSFSAFGGLKSWEDWMLQAPPISAAGHSEENNPDWNVGLYGSYGNVPTQTPLWSISRLGDKRFSWLNGEGWWRWKVFAFAETGSHSSFENAVLEWAQWLTVNNGNERFRADYAYQLFSGEPFDVRFTVLDQALQSFDGASIRTVLRRDGETIGAFPAQNIGNGRYRLVIPQLEPGTYQFSSTATLGEETLAASGQFVMVDQSMELLDTRARFSELRSLSSETGGVFYSWSHRDRLLENLDSLEAQSVIHETVERTPLFSRWWPYVLILFLLTSEWVLRKREGVL